MISQPPPRDSLAAADAFAHGVMNNSTASIVVLMINAVATM
jgi:hypothetical protein